MLKKLLGALLVVVIVLVGGAYLLPREVHVQRSIVVDRPAAAVFPLVNSLHRFNEWSPWRQLDPNAKITYSGPDSGVGSAMAWVGNSKVGRGNQVITESVPDTRVDSSIEFGDMGGGKAALSLAADGPATEVVWSLDVDLGNNPIGRYMGLFMDKTVGPDYERGLKSLKTLAEAAPAPDATTPGDAAQPASATTTSPNAATS